MDATLGAQFLIWEYATAVAGRLIGINPFDQPDVESAKEAARAMLEGTGAAPDPAFVDGPVAVFATEGLARRGRATTSRTRSTRCCGRLDPEVGYLAVMAYLDRLGDAELAGVRDVARAPDRPSGHLRLGSAVPALDRSVPQGRAPTGVFLQVTGRAEARTWRSPADRSPSVGSSRLRRSATRTVLAGHGRPVLRLHLTDHDAGLAAVREVLGR